MYYKRLIFTLLSMLIFIKASPNKRFYPKLDKWQSLQAGDLLRSLDLITADTQSQLLPSPGVTMHRRVERNAESGHSSEDHPPAESETNNYDYDKAYERFVQRYFATGRRDALDEDSVGEESEETQSFSASNDSKELLQEPQTAASTHKSRDKCKKIRKNHQLCIVCKNSKNNENSESCSYSMETKPRTYAYSKQHNYRKHQDGSDEGEGSAEEKQDEDKKSRKPSKTKRNKSEKRGAGRIRRSRGLEMHQDMSSCIKKVQQQKICYYCLNPGGEQLIKCFASDAEDDADKKRSEHVKRSERKIIKRMISYSYKKRSDSKAPESSEDVLERNLTAETK